MRARSVAVAGCLAAACATGMAACGGGGGSDNANGSNGKVNGHSHAEPAAGPDEIETNLLVE